ncbi:MAG: SIMPL domain-containing protein [Maricaulaceae bacterium]
MRRVVFVLAGAGALLAAPALAHDAEPSADTPSILSLSARVEVTASPDLAIVSAGVVEEAETAKAAMAAQRTRMTAVFDALAEAGIKGADLQTSGLSLQPVYAELDPDAPGDGPIVRYSASNRITVTTRDLDAIGQLVDALVDAGVNQIRSVQFELSGRAERVEQARLEAVRELVAKAQAMAEAAGVRAGRILTLEDSANPRPRGEYIVVSGSRLSGSTPLAPGALTLRAEVYGTFELSAGKTTHDDHGHHHDDDHHHDDHDHDHEHEHDHDHDHDHEHSHD